MEITAKKDTLCHRSIPTSFHKSLGLDANTGRLHPFSSTTDVTCVLGFAGSL